MRRMNRSNRARVIAIAIPADQDKQVRLRFAVGMGLLASLSVYILSMLLK